MNLVKDYNKIHKKGEIDEIKKDWYYTDEYVAETISNFKELLDAGIIDISVLEKEKIIQK